MPFTKVVRTAPRPGALPPPTTLGEHLRSVRDEQGLLQREVAQAIGVTAATIAHWERNMARPPIALMPAIIRFIGFDPSPAPTTLSERMRSYRQRHGLSIKEAAQRAGVDESSWGQWERTGLIPWKRYRALLEEFLIQGHRDDAAATDPDDVVP